MKTFFARAILLLPMIALAGCATSPADFETPPVQVQTAKGVVTCQLYTPDLVHWDRSVDRPNSMSVKEADGVCRAEGERLKNA